MVRTSTMQLEHRKLVWTEKKPAEWQAENRPFSQTHYSASAGPVRFTVNLYNENLTSSFQSNEISPSTDRGSPLILALSGHLSWSLPSRKKERCKELIEFPAHRHRCATGAQRGRLLGAHLELSTAWLVRTLWFPHTSLHLRRLAVNHKSRETSDKKKQISWHVHLYDFPHLPGQTQDLCVVAHI